MTPTPFVAVSIARESERMKTYCKGILSAALWILLTVTCHAQTPWTITDLGMVNSALGINNSGQAVGDKDFTSSGGSHAFLWSSGTGAQDLGTLPGGTCSVAFSINNSGQVVGFSCALTSFVTHHAFLWSSTSGMQDLGTLGGSQSHANDINDNG